jgi:hypothetical protein
MTKRILKSIFYAIGSGILGGVTAYVICPGKFEEATVPFATLFTILLSLIVVPSIVMES